MQENPDYIPVEEAAQLLGVTTRQAARYGERVRTKRVGKRVLYHRDDIAQIAQERNLERSYERSTTLTSDEFLTYLRERDQQLASLIKQLLDAAHRIGVLEEQLRNKDTS